MLRRQIDFKELGRAFEWPLQLVGYVLTTKK